MDHVWHERTVDAGIDGTIELRDPATGEVSNCHLQVQSKVGDNDFPGETADRFQYDCDEPDLDYWMKSPQRISDQTIFSWRRHHHIDRGEPPRLTTKDQSELTTADKRTAELETEPKIAGCGRAVQGGNQPRTEVKLSAAEGQPVQVACIVLGVSESGPRGDAVRTIPLTTYCFSGRRRHRHLSNRQVTTPAQVCRRARDT